MSLEVISLLKLPLAGVESIIKLKNEKCNRALASSLHTPQDIVNELAQSKSTMVSSKALRRSNNTSLVNEVAKQNSIKSIGALWNPLVSSEILVQQLDSENRTLAAIAFAHPNTPLEIRKEKLTPELADKITDVGGALGEGVVRAMEIALNNPWLRDEPAKWPNLIRRALSNLPETTLSDFTSIKKAGWSGWKTSQFHPAKNGLDVKEYSPKALVAINSAATDYLAATHPDLTFKQAQDIFAFNRNMPEPHVVSRLVERFGMEIFYGTYALASTRVTSSAWRVPMIEYYQQFNKFDTQDTQAGLTILGDDHKGWETFLKLYSNWTGSIKDLAIASLNI